MAAKKKERWVQVIDAEGKPVKRSKDEEPWDDVVAVLVVDGRNKILHAVEWDIETIEKAIEKVQKKGGVSEVMLARDVANLGEDASTLVNQEILAALKRRATAKKEK